MNFLDINMVLTEGSWLASCFTRILSKRTTWMYAGMARKLEAGRVSSQWTKGQVLLGTDKSTPWESQLWLPLCPEDSNPNGNLFLTVLRSYQQHQLHDSFLTAIPSSTPISPSTHSPPTWGWVEQKLQAATKKKTAYRTTEVSPCALSQLCSFKGRRRRFKLEKRQGFGVTKSILSL